MSVSSEASLKPNKPLNDSLYLFSCRTSFDPLADESPRLLTNALVNIYVGEENTHWILHERLLCYHSPFFRRLFYSPDFEASKTKVYGLPDIDDKPFELFVGWLYSKAIKAPAAEKDVGPLLDLYLLGNKLEIEALGHEVVDLIRNFFHNEDTFPGLRRVQYIYANTDEDNEMREMMVGSVARYLTLGDAIPKHWENALKNNGQLSVDIIRTIQQWHLEGRSVPDVRDLSQERGREQVGFSKVEEGTSIKEEEAESVNGSHT
ncbi:uncharacterized protein KY384_000205 [Bacidia gigantensis]|uniref:uncharacterized protein n=1 Tax=Bacidia gigantensis TaxID=2732470 RepID=UPI001D039A2F|nr:uncharacterized protein KY384_000205 [Bacidia gigantensis]KAG8526212.1 hypothetical protein KY384_000205 [Bacidia gigantensis]